jgi:hypothetical protein
MKKTKEIKEDPGMKEAVTNHYDRKKELYRVIEGMIKTGTNKQNDIVLAAMRTTGFGERIIVKYMDYLMAADFIVFEGGKVKWRD